MKTIMKINNIRKSMLVMALAASGLGLTSCEDEPDKYEISDGVPTVYYIRPVDVDSKDSLLTSASMSEYICFVGDNMRSVIQVDFNDQTAVLNTSLITDHTLIVQVPGDIPETVTDKVYLICKKDTVAIDFEVTISAPTISSMSNEWAAAGEEVTIIGDYFLSYDNYPMSISVGDDFEMTMDDIIEYSKTSIVFEMPSDFPQNEDIYITTKYGSTKAPFQYMDNRGMLFDFDTPYDGVAGHVLGNHGWHDAAITSDENSLSGYYLQFGNGTATMDGSTWDDTHFSFEYWPGTWSYDFEYDGDWDGTGTWDGSGGGPKLCDIFDFSDWENKSFKFEMYIPSDYSWSAAPMQIIFAGTDKILYYDANNTFFHAQDGWPRALYMPWDTDDGYYTTDDKWETVTIPMTDFNKEYDGNKADGSFSSTDDFASLTMFIVRGSYDDASVISEGTECTPIIRVDNIRLVPNE